MENIKLLFLPQCLKSEYSQKIEEVAKKRGYKVYTVPGGSLVKKILAKYPKIDKIVGIACKDEVNLALEYTRKLAKKGTIIKPIILLTNGCKNTEVNLKKVIKVLDEK
jgi:hypothetical protein